MWETFLACESQILLWIQELRNPLLTPVFQIISLIGEYGAVWLLMSALFLCFPETRKAGFMGFLSMGITFLIVNVFLKNSVERIRPYETIPDLIHMAVPPKDFSFPSGHAASSFAAAVVFYKELPGKYRVFPLILAFLMAFSRLYLGVHYLSDVFCGGLTGAADALIVCSLHRMVLKRKENSA